MAYKRPRREKGKGNEKSNGNGKGSAQTGTIAIGALTYTLLRSRRKTLAIHIKSDASLEIRAPLHTSEEAIKYFVESKSDWIGTHFSRISGLLARKSEFSLDYGDSVLLFGEEHVILAGVSEHAANAMSGSASFSLGSGGADCNCAGSRGIGDADCHDSGGRGIGDADSRDSSGRDMGSRDMGSRDISDLGQPVRPQNGTRAARGGANRNAGGGDGAALGSSAAAYVAAAGKGLGIGDGFVVMPGGMAPDEIKAALIRIYRRLAKQNLGERVAEYASIMGVRPASVRITGAKTRWGSCSGKNSVNFSWRLIMAPNDVIDYVVIHELAHIRQHNHSAAFWSVVAAYMPDYRSRRAGLKALQSRLAGENWD
ncbi:MAG: M48 family metallopeptidase [Clostridiales bacterium]|jgi:predicted metal-dependent hydrolase|nr:M48 family metallopeptidase [Clostridiales bacterium]